MLHIREAVGRAVELRADANQKWLLSEALQFGHAVKAAGLQVSAGLQATIGIAFRPAHFPLCQLFTVTFESVVTLLYGGLLFCCGSWLCLEENCYLTLKSH